MHNSAQPGAVTKLKTMVHDALSLDSSVLFCLFQLRKDGGGDPHPVNLPFDPLHISSNPTGLIQRQMAIPGSSARCGEIYDKSHISD